MILCACLGIVEGLILGIAGLLGLIPFWFKGNRRKKCEHKELRGPRGRRIPYVTSADMIKMNKRKR